MLRIFLIFIFFTFPIELKAQSCFEACMKNETIPAVCFDKCKTEQKRNTNQKKIFKKSQSNAERMRRIQQSERDKYRDQKNQAIKKKELEKLIAEKRELLKDINLGCYTVCMRKKNQDRYCENICIDKKPSEIKTNTIDTGDTAVDQMIVDCYQDCFKSAKLSPSCLHSCCYICAKQKFNESTGHFEDKRSPLSLDCLDRCVSNGTDQTQCENICSGYYSTNKE